MGKRSLGFFSVSGIILVVVFLDRVFSGRLILQQYFSIGPLTIHYYGIIMALAVACAFFVAIKRAEKYGINPKSAEDLIFWLIVGGFVGARVYHVASHFVYYGSYPGEILKVWNGGLSIFGAILGGLLTLWICNRLNPKPLPTGQAGLALSAMLDWLTPSIAIGQIIGRFGNLFNYEAFGYPTNLPWKMFVPQAFRPQQYHEVTFFHPFFLYEALGNTIILIILLKIIKPQTPGKLFFCYLLLYNILRFGLEFIRLDSTFVYGLRLNAYVALLMMACSAAALLWIKKYGEKT